MRILDKILSLLKTQNKSQKELTDYLGISKNVFTDWKSGKNKSYTKYLPEISLFFNCSVDYLLGRTDKFSTESNELASKNVKFIGKDGTVKFKKISPEMIAILEQLPDSDDKL